MHINPTDVKHGQKVEVHFPNGDVIYTQFLSCEGGVINTSWGHFTKSGPNWVAWVHPDILLRTPNAGVKPGRPGE